MTGDTETRTVAGWFENGRQCFHLTDGMGAVRAFERVVEEDPGYRHPDGDNAYFYLGKINEVENRLDAAVLHYTRSLAVNSADEESLIGRGSCYTVLGEHERAIADFTRVLRFPDSERRSSRAHLLYGIAENYRQMKAWEQALDWGRRALSAAPDNYRHQQLVKEVEGQAKTGGGHS